jgi:hypothetical protein
MQQEDKLNTKAIKILIPLAVICGVIAIFKGGFNFGQWLYVLLH